MTRSGIPTTFDLRADVPQLERRPFPPWTGAPAPEPGRPEDAPAATLAAARSSWKRPPSLGTELAVVCAALGVAAGLALALLDRLGVLGLGTALAVQGSVLAAAALAGGRLSRPVRELLRTTRRAARGDLTARASVERWDELGLLTVGLNHLLSCQQLHRRRLEREISARARDLAVARRSSGPRRRSGPTAPRRSSPEPRSFVFRDRAENDPPAVA